MMNERPNTALEPSAPARWAAPRLSANVMQTDRKRRTRVTEDLVGVLKSTQRAWAAARGIETDADGYCRGRDANLFEPPLRMFTP